jgi:hypothetical protein
MIGLLWMFCGSFRLSLLPLAAALAAVVWELGLLRLAGFGLDPFAILVDRHNQRFRFETAEPEHQYFLAFHVHVVINNAL